MPLYKVEIVETRSSFAFVRAASPAAARALVDSNAEECRDIIHDTPGDIDAGCVWEIEAVPEGYEIDFIADGDDMDGEQR